MTTQSIRWFWFSSPATFYPLAGTVAWIAGVLAVALTVAGLYVGFVVAPTDATQGEAYRIIYLHVPAAWMSMFLYVVMAFWSAVGLAMNARLSFILARAIAPTGALFTFIALWTGSLWGKPTWGTWWVWDARLTSELLLLFLYLGYMALRASFDDPQRADRASAVLALVGVINVPIIHYSVEWWTTLHQPASVTKLDKPSIQLAMLIPLFIMITGFQLYFGWAISRRLRGEILRRERNAKWLEEAA